MNDEAKREANELFRFVLRCYPDALTGLNLSPSSTVYRIYLYGVLKTVFGTKMDEYVKMYLLNQLRHEIGLSADQLAAEIMKYASEEKD